MTETPGGAPTRAHARPGALGTDPGPDLADVGTAGPASEETGAVGQPPSTGGRDQPAGPASPADLATDDAAPKEQARTPDPDVTQGPPRASTDPPRDTGTVDDPPEPSVGAGPSGPAAPVGAEDDSAASVGTIDAGGPAEAAHPAHTAAVEDPAGTGAHGGAGLGEHPTTRPVTDGAGRPPADQAVAAPTSTVAASTSPSGASAPVDGAPADVAPADRSPAGTSATDAAPPGAPPVPAPPVPAPEVPGAGEVARHRRRRRRRLRVAGTATVVVLLLGLGASSVYLYVAASAWEERAETYLRDGRAIGDELATTRAELAGTEAELDAVRSQLATAQSRIVELADEKAQLGDDREVQRQLADYQERVSDAAGQVALALDQCVQGQQQLIGYLQSTVTNAAQYDPAELERFRTDVEVLCQAATEANIALQRELSR